MAGRVSAMDAMSLAFGRTERLLFRPFRFGLWARLAVVGLITGEVGGLGGSGGVPNGNVSLPKTGGDQLRLAALFFSEPGWEQVQQNLVWLVPLFLTVIALVLLWVYSACIYRFILLDAVLTGQCRLREGWRKWRDSGRQYFLWVLAFGFIGLVVLGVVAGIPLLLAWRAGWLQKGEEHIGGLLGWGLLLGLVLVLLIVLMAVIDLFGRDFLIPVMALENVDAIEGWRRLLGIVGQDKSSYVLYVVMKTVLALGSAIAFTVANIIVVLLSLIPLGLLALLGFLIGQALHVPWDNISVILILAALGLLAMAGILYVVGLIYAPALVFFQAYALEFFAPRYDTLKAKMFPAPAPPNPPRASIPPWPQMPPMAPPTLPGDAFPA